LKDHLTYTGSSVANLILKDLTEQLKFFVKVFPKEYKNAIVAKKGYKKALI
jgi:glutamate synthase (NADPH/NADH) large chain